MGEPDIHVFRVTCDAFGGGLPELDGAEAIAAEPAIRQQVEIVERTIGRLFGQLELAGIALEQRPGENHPRSLSVRVTATGTALLSEDEADELQRVLVDVVRGALRLLRLPPEAFRNGT